MYVRGIIILPREDSVMEKGLKKLIKGQCPLRDMATAWELKLKFENLGLFLVSTLSRRNVLPKNLKSPTQSRLGTKLYKLKVAESSSLTKFYLC